MDGSASRDRAHWDSAAAATAATERLAADSATIDQLDEEIGRLAQHMHGDSYRLLELVREFDDRLGYLRSCHKNCAEWLAWRLQIKPAAAREKVRTAHALRRLPVITSAFAGGLISYSKARELTRVAEECDEEQLLGYALNGTAPQVAERCRQIRNVRPESAAEARRNWERRALAVSRKPSRNTVLISVELPAADAEIVLKALQCAVASGEMVALGADHLAAHGEERSKTDGWMAQQADALVAVSRAYLAGDVGEPAAVAEERDAPGGADLHAGGCSGTEGEVGAQNNATVVAEVRTEADVSTRENATAVAFSSSPDPKSNKRAARPRSRGTSIGDHYQVVVHVDERALRGFKEHGDPAGKRAGSGEGAPFDHALPPRSDLPLETIRRLTCDCALIALVEDEHGNPLGISRKRRIVPAPLNRALIARDRCCVFPGCHRSIYLDRHHVKHWINGGKTTLENVIRICSYHHALLHEGGFSMRKRPDGTFDFLRPDGRVLPRSGYRLEDMCDDDGDPHGGGQCDEKDEVRELPPRYGERPAAAHACA